MPFDVGAAWSDPSWTSSDKFGVGGGFSPRGGWPEYTGSIGPSSNIDWNRAPDTAWGTKSSYNVDKSSSADGFDIMRRHLNNFAQSRGLLGDGSSNKSDSAGGFGGGVQQINDNLSAVFTPQFKPFTIAGTPGSPGWGKTIGMIAGGLLAAPFTGGMSVPAALGVIGGGAALGGDIGGSVPV